jgi:AcrR family transcriptional regulator
VPGRSSSGNTVLFNGVISPREKEGNRTYFVRYALPGNEEGVVARTSQADEPSWREQAVARSLDSARLRAESRVQRFLEAAIELLNSGPSKDFTVQEVVERSGQSLRSFYQYFGGKHELILALFDESVRWTADYLREAIAGEDGSLERLHGFVVECYRVCRRVGESRTVVSVQPPIVAGFAQQLLTTHPMEAARAFAPLVALFEELLEEAVATNAIRQELIMFNGFLPVIGDSSARSEDDDSAEAMWKFVLHGIGTIPPA